MMTDESSYPLWKSEDVIFRVDDGSDISNIEYKYVIAALDVSIRHEVVNHDISWIEQVRSKANFTSFALLLNQY